MEKEILEKMLSDAQKDILRCMWECNLCVRDVAKRLNYSTKGVYYHLDVIRKRTGLDPKKVLDLAELRKLL